MNRKRGICPKMFKVQLREKKREREREKWSTNSQTLSHPQNKINHTSTYFSGYPLDPHGMIPSSRELKAGDRNVEERPRNSRDSQGLIHQWPFQVPNWRYLPCVRPMWRLCKGISSQYGLKYGTVPPLQDPEIPIESRHPFNWKQNFDAFHRHFCRVGLKEGNHFQITWNHLSLETIGNMIKYEIGLLTWRCTWFVGLYIP